jgi:lysophospholipase L1-like esterase
MAVRAKFLLLLFLKVGALLVFVAALSVAAILYYQGKQPPRKNSAYVALGSSFAAGLGLGAREVGSPLVCQRSVNGYPQQLARQANLALTDMTCSGATIRHVLMGGQVFLGPQIDALGQDTKLVTITAGGNDIGYVGDLTAMAYRRKGGFIGTLTGWFWSGAKPVVERNFAQLEADLLATLREIHRRSPTARIVVVTYPAILPETGTCLQLGIDATQADLMRSVALRLAEATRSAARAAGATVIDIANISRGHDACSALPWVNGSAPAHGAPFHPTLAGARAIADQIQLSLNSAPL